MSTKHSNNILLESVRAEDYVEYFLFPSVRSPDNNSVDQDLAQLTEQINRIAAEYCGNYIWHKDGFRVAPRFGNAHLLIEQTLDNSGKLYGGGRGKETMDEEYETGYLLLNCVCVCFWVGYGSTSSFDRYEQPHVCLILCRPGLGPLLSWDMWCSSWERSPLR